MAQCEMLCLTEVEGNRTQSTFGINICSKYNSKSTKLTVVSPGFPQSYPPDTECRCVVTAQPHSKVSHILPYMHRGWARNNVPLHILAIALVFMGRFL